MQLVIATPETRAERLGRDRAIKRGSEHGTAVALIVLCAFLLRLVVAAVALRHMAGLSPNHREFGLEMGWTARSLAEGRGFSSPFAPSTGPTALVPPLYPYLLSVVFRICGVYTLTAAAVILSINSICSAITCVPLYLYTRRCVGERLALTASLAWAVHPFGIYFSAARVWDYSLTCLLLTTCIYVALVMQTRTERWLWIGYGMLFGCTALSNPSVLILFAPLLIWAIRRVPSTRTISCGVLACLGLLLVVGPWVFRTYRVLVQCPIFCTSWMVSVAQLLKYLDSCRMGCGELGSA